MSTQKALLREKIRSGAVSIGSWLQIGHPAVLEIMSEYNFDWLTVDLEHSDISIETFTNMLRGNNGKQTSVLARVKKNAPLDIRQVLDVGADGVIVPLVNSAKEAEDAVTAAKYAPLGNRGFAFCRANKYGKEFDTYTRDANESIIVIIMIETKEAVEDIDAILSVSGVDGVLIGPYDLSGSYGIPGQSDALIVQHAMDKVLASCKVNRKAAGLHVVLPEKGSVERAIERGFSFIAAGMDNVFLGSGIESFLQNLNNKDVEKLI
jgi:2-dehydro-3-deoxyglucarate aldolase